MNNSVKNRQSMFILGSNLNLAPRHFASPTTTVNNFDPQQYHRQRQQHFIISSCPSRNSRAINMNIRQQQEHGNSISRRGVTATTAVAAQQPRTSELRERRGIAAALVSQPTSTASFNSSTSAAVGHQHLPSLHPPTSILSIKSSESQLAAAQPSTLSPGGVSAEIQSARLKSTGKRVSLVDERGGENDVTSSQTKYKLGAAAAAGVTPNKIKSSKKARHISQLNSSENCSTITSTTSLTDEQSENSAQRHTQRGSSTTSSSTAATVVARNKSKRRKVFHHKQQQRSILQIPRLDLPRSLEFLLLLFRRDSSYLFV